MTTPDGPGDFATINKGEGDQKNWFQQAAGRGSSLVGASQDVQDASSPPEWGVATLSLRAEQLSMLTSPGQAFMSNGLGFLVSIVLSPLIELAEWAIGDPEQMRATGQGWEKIGNWLEQVADQETRRAEATAQSWKGQDADAFRKQMAEFSEGVKALSGDIKELKDTLDMIADIFDMFVEFFVEVVTELIIGLIVQWIAALAASWITAGASVGAASAGTAVEGAATGGRIAGRIAQMQGKLFQMFRKIEQLLQKIRKNIPGFQRMAKKLADMRGGNFIEKGVARKLDKNPAIKFLSKADDEFASKGGKMFGQDGIKAGEKQLDDMMKGASDSAKTAAKDAYESIPKHELKGVEGLVHNTVTHGLAGHTGGTTDWKLASRNVGMDMAKEKAVEFGANEIYDQGRGAIQGDLSDDQRQGVEKRGFE